MASIYSNSFITLAAAHESSVRGGLLPVRPEFAVRKFISSSSRVYRIQCRTEQRTWILNGTLEEDTLPLFGRGWVLQETALAPRTLICDRDEVAWAYRHSKARQLHVGMTEATLPNSTATTKTIIRHVQLQKRGDLHDNYRKLLPKWWRDMVETYTTKKFSYADDRLAALAGIASIFGETSGKHLYVAGMWKGHTLTKSIAGEYNDLLEHLMWFAILSSEPDNDEPPAATTTPQPSTNAAAEAALQPPTWSWLSHCGGVRYSPNVDSDDFVVTRTAEVHDATNDPSPLHTSGNPLIECRGGRLVLLGPALWGRCIFGRGPSSGDSGGRGNDSAGELVFEECPGKPSIHFRRENMHRGKYGLYLDDESSFMRQAADGEVTQILCLFTHHVQRSRLGKQTINIGLALKLMREEGVFVRVGLIYHEYQKPEVDLIEIARMFRSGHKKATVV